MTQYVALIKTIIIVYIIFRKKYIYFTIFNSKKQKIIIMYKENKEKDNYSDYSNYSNYKIKRK